MVPSGAPESPGSWRFPAGRLRPVRVDAAPSLPLPQLFTAEVSQQTPPVCPDRRGGLETGPCNEGPAATDRIPSPHPHLWRPRVLQSNTQPAPPGGAFVPRASWLRIVLILRSLFGASSSAPNFWESLLDTPECRLSPMLEPPSPTLQPWGGSVCKIAAPPFREAMLPQPLASPFPKVLSGMSLS